MPYKVNESGNIYGVNENGEYVGVPFYDDRTEAEFWARQANSIGDAWKEIKKLKQQIKEFKIPQCSSEGSCGQTPSLAETLAQQLEDSKAKIVLEEIGEEGYGDSVIPVFKTMFEGMGGQLPGPTAFLINASEFARHYFLYIVAILVIIFIAFKRFYKTEKGRLVVDSLLLKAPIFGDLLKKVAVAKFSRTLSTMMSSGVPILEGLAIVSKTSGNKVVEDALLKTRQSIAEGRSIAEPLAETGIFPPMVVQMISVGEATGALDSMLNKIAIFYDDEIDVAVDAMTALLEPIMMVFLGGIVGGMIIAMYLPIFKLASVVG